ncbi:RNA-binding domain-containing protein [Trametes coccinea BRFM310]|uniref:RNA-binding domain-containing protein n=1 Tax=Trametes coccinea (strain BRFM310) TaxID=1353009 RepID=A0A1Y2ICY7_TRAC3|nr:RNA-binding domain-containing protein [Trametes coccinea BRFM310]
MSSSTSGSSSESDQASSSSLPPHKRQRLSSDDSSDSDSDREEGPHEDDDTPVLSHAEKRRQKKKEKRGVSEDADAADDSTGKKGKAKVKNTAELAPSKVPKRQNSVWVGNLSFKTTPDALKGFFDGVGEITRIHMPMKMVTGGPGDRPRQENRGFAYVDFATPDAKTVAITLSERPLDGRRLLIKDGDDFNGRPAAAATAGTEGGAESGAAKPAGLTKTAQKILRVQKQPPGPTLFFGNLGFETTEESIRELLNSHRPKTVDEKWIRKVRMGTFEDSGKCKGWAFVDFTSTENATAALTNPRNHTLNGRKLVVEYASPEAVRRGGGGPPRADKGHGGGQRGERRPGKRERDSGRAEDAAEGEQRPAKKRHADGGDEAEEKGARGKRFDAGGKGGKNPRARARPGAALALAKREDVSIVPSQGKKIVFS